MLISNLFKNAKQLPPKRYRQTTFAHSEKSKNSIFQSLFCRHIFLHDMFYNFSWSRTLPGIPLICHSSSVCKCYFWEMCTFCLMPTLIKKKIKFSSYIRKFRVEQLPSHMTNGLLSPHIRGNIWAFPHILGSHSSYMTLQLLHSEFPYKLGKFDFLFYQCILMWLSIIIRERIQMHNTGSKGISSEIKVFLVTTFFMWSLWMKTIIPAPFTLVDKVEFFMWGKPGWKHSIIILTYLTN